MAFVPDPSLAAYWHQLRGTVLQRLQRYAEAETEYTRALDIGSDYDIYACQLRVDGTLITGSARASTVDLDLFGSINDEENCATDGVVSVDAGDHTVALWVGRTADKAKFGQAVVWALFVPFNGQGNPYVP